MTPSSPPSRSRTTARGRAIGGDDPVLQAAKGRAKAEIADILKKRPCPSLCNSSRGPSKCECWFDYRDVDQTDLTQAADSLLNFRRMDGAEQKQHTGRILCEGRQYRKEVQGRARRHKCFKVTGLPHRICKGRLAQLFRRGNDWLNTAEREADPTRAGAPNPTTLRWREFSKRKRLSELLGRRGAILHCWKQPLRQDVLGGLRQMVHDLAREPSCEIGTKGKETHFEIKENMGFSRRLLPGRNFPLLHSYTTAQFVDQSLLPEGKEVRLLADGILYRQKAQCVGYGDFPVLHEVQHDTLATLRRTKARLFLGEAIRALPPAQGDAWDAIIEADPCNPCSRMSDKSGDPFAFSLAAMSLHVQSEWQVTEQSVYMPHIDIFGEFVCFVQIFGSSFTFVSERCDDPSVTAAYFDEEDDGSTSWEDYSRWKESLGSTNSAEWHKIVAYEREFRTYVDNELRSRTGRLFRIRVYRLTPGRRLAFAAGESEPNCHRLPLSPQQPVLTNQPTNPPPPPSLPRAFPPGTYPHGSVILAQNKGDAARALAVFHCLAWKS